jgi:hypothetical protein
MDAIAEGAKAWDDKVALGREQIRSRWQYLHPKTRDYLAAHGYDRHGRHVESADLPEDIGQLEYSLGVFQEARSAEPPGKKGDPIPPCLTNDNVLHEAANLLFDRRACDPEFVRAAIHACIKQQFSSAVSFLYFSGGSIEGKRVTLPRTIGRIAAFVIFSLGLPFAVGNGLASAFQGDGAAASLFALFAMFAYGVLKAWYKKPETPEYLAYQAWFSLMYRGFHIGTGHGIEKQLADMLRRGVGVPSVLFDLCAALQQGTRYSAGEGTTPPHPLPS